MAIRIIHKLSQFHSSVFGNVERGTISKCNVDRASRSGLDHVASIDQIPDLDLTGWACRNIGLNNDSGRMFDADDSGRGYDLPNGVRVKPRGRLRGTVLAPSQGR